MAFAYAKRLLCEHPTEQDSCGACSSCRWFEEGVHPDFRFLDKGDERVLKVERIRREVLADLNMKPQIGRCKVYVLAADDMNEQGQNALLKSLEEPPPEVYFLLTAERPDVLLDTIRSRSVSLKPELLSKEQLKQLLEREGLKDNADFVAAFSGGIPGRALELAGNEAYTQLREKIFELSAKIGKSRAVDRLTRDQAVLTEEKDQLEMIFALCQSVLRDLLLLVQDDQAVISNRDKQALLLRMARELHDKVGIEGFAERTRQFEAALQTLRRAVTANVNFEILSWQFLTEFHELLKT